MDFRSFKLRKKKRYPLDFLSPAGNSIGVFQFLLFVSAFVCRLPLFLFYSIIFTLCTFALLLQKHLCLKNLKYVSIWRNQITFTVSFFFLKFLFILALMVIFIVHSSLCVFKSSFLCYIFGQFKEIVTIVFLLSFRNLFYGEWWRRKNRSSTYVPGYRGQKANCRKWSFPSTSWFRQI